MEAIGMIETKGLIAVIEALDVMLKTSDVSFLKKEKIGAGYVSVIVQGDVAAVKAAVDAAISSVNALGENLLKSHHVIPRASNQIEIIFKDDEVLKVEEGSKEKEEIEVFEKIETQDETELVQEKEEIESESEKVEIEEEFEEIETQTQDKETIKEIEQSEDEETQEDFQQDETDTQDTQNEQETDTKSEETITIENIKDKKLTKEIVDELVEKKGIDESIKILEKLKVNEIRTLARKYKDGKLSSKEISKYSKKRLLKEMKNYYQGGGM